MDRLGSLYRPGGLVFASNVGGIVNPSNLRDRFFARLLAWAGVCASTTSDIPAPRCCFRGTAEEALYAEGLDQVEALADARRMRLVAAHEGIPAVLWVVLVFAGVAMVGFTYLFGLESTWAHRLMVAALAGVIGLVLFTIGAMEHPFSGGASIGTGAFELILERFETSRLSDLR